MYFLFSLCSCVSSHYRKNIDKCEFLTGEEMSSDQSRIREQPEFTHSPLRKDFEKQIKTVEEQKSS